MRTVRHVHDAEGANSPCDLDQSRFHSSAIMRAQSARLRLRGMSKWWAASMSTACGSSWRRCYVSYSRQSSAQRDTM
jgi:hypothetical protein